MMLPVFWIIFAFVIWIFSFLGFLNLKLTIINDAISYFEHTKFYVESLGKGVFSMWNPTWFFGAPNDFFLRRLGAFNPFYGVIILLESIGIRYSLAYIWFLAFYFWSGSIAFYLLSMRLYNHRLMAYGGYLIFLFSALGTRIFDAYMMLVTVPLIWFFYCLVAFTQKSTKQHFLGMCLFFMILSSTYIPFYFLSFFALFVIFFGLFYFYKIPQIFRSYLDFFNTNKILVILSLGIVLLSFAPLLTFFHNSSKGQIVLPMRHGNSDSTSALTVPLQTLDWGIVEDLVFSFFHSDLSTYKFAIVYVPFFAIILFLLGVVCRISRRAMFLFVCAVVLLCGIIPHGLPFYDVLYKHIFFLKYFRNLHFFLWFVLIPLFILLVLEHWQMFSDWSGRIEKRKLLVYVVLVHVFVFLFVWFRADAIASTYVMLALSFIFWFLRVMGLLKENVWAFALLTVTIVVQPLEVYHHLSLRAQKSDVTFYEPHGSASNKLVFKGPDVTSLAAYERGYKPEIYYASSFFDILMRNIYIYPLRKYLQYKFLFVDHLETMDRRNVDFEVLEKSFLSNANKAYIFKDEASGLKMQGSDPHPLPQAALIEEEGKDFKVLSFDANHIKLAINIPYDKFFIYNDTFDQDWKAKVNGQRVHLYQTNVGYKGVWLPAGQNIVEFRYGQFWHYAMNYILLLGAYLFVFGIIWFSRKK